MSYLLEKYNSWTIDRIEPYCLTHFEIHDREQGKGYKSVDIQSLSNSIAYRNLVVEKRAKTSRLIMHLERVQKRGTAVREVLKK